MRTCIGCGQQVHDYDIYMQDGMAHHLGCAAYVDHRKILYTFSEPVRTMQAHAIMGRLPADALLGTKEGKVIIYQVE